MDVKIHRGVDLSHHNGRLDFGTIKASGIEFVALKATEGASYIDPTFLDNQKRARAVGFAHLLFYHFFQPRVDPAMQAMNLAAAVGRLGPNEAVVVDVEEALKNGADQWAGISPETGRDRLHDFVFHLKRALGIKASQVILYGSPGWLRGQFKGALDDLTFMPLWAARYGPQLGDVSPWKKALIWQYSESGDVPGAGDKGGDDLDVWMNPGAWAA